MASLINLFLIQGRLRRRSPPGVLDPLHLRPDRPLRGRELLATFLHREGQGLRGQHLLLRRGLVPGRLLRDPADRRGRSRAGRHLLHVEQGRRQRGAREPGGRGRGHRLWRRGNRVEVDETPTLARGRGGAT